MSAPQSYKNHVRFDPLFHYVIGPILLLNVVCAITYTVRHYSHWHLGAWMIVFSIALLLIAMKLRIYALKVQDRVIRLEEKTRLATLVTPSELMELESLTVQQYVALRFASNVELPALARRAVREKLTNKQIKEAVVSWRADNDRV